MAFSAPVSCRGRRGPRRVRVNQCLAVFHAEELYSKLLKDKPTVVRPGWRGGVAYTVEGASHAVQWEVRANAVWRRGRVFFICPRCRNRCTRLYVPCVGFSPCACRQCCGLTYTSRALLNYKDSMWGRGPFARMFGTTQRDYAYEITAELRQKRRARSRARWDERRPILEELAKSEDA